MAGTEREQAKVCPRVLCTLTLFLQKHAALGDNDRYVAINVAFSVLIDEGDGNVGIGDTLAERNAENAVWSVICWRMVST